MGMRRGSRLAVATAILVVGAVAAIAGVDAPSGLALAGGAGPRAVVCPAQGGSSQPPCCGPIAARPSAEPCCGGGAQPICCPPNAQCASPLTISSQPNPSTAGQPVTVSGQTGSGMSGQQVALWQRVAGSPGFSRIATATIGSTGAYSFRLANVETNRAWYVTAGGLQSVTIEQRVRAAIDVTSGEGGCARHSMTITMRGRMIPAQPGHELTVQARHGHGRWRVLARIRLTRRAFVIVRRFRAPGSVELRLLFPGDRRNAPARSGISASSCS